MSTDELTELKEQAEHAKEDPTLAPGPAPGEGG